MVTVIIATYMWLIANIPDISGNFDVGDIITISTLILSAVSYFLNQKFLNKKFIDEITESKKISVGNASEIQELKTDVKLIKNDMKHITAKLSELNRHRGH